jgi:hypothetical protein
MAAAIESFSIGTSFWMGDGEVIAKRTVMDRG